MAKTYESQLNKQQQEAVIQTKGPSIILAGAGSGKTRVLTYKVLQLVENSKVDPSAIVMITFTNKAAAEMKERIINKYQQIKLGYIGTFHSFCARLLRIEGEHIGISRSFVIYDESDQLDIIKTILKDKGIKKFTPSYALNRISSAKNELISEAQYLKIFSDYYASDISKIYSIYQKTLIQNQALDFDDLLLKTIELFKAKPKILEKYQNRYRFFLIDEFHDTNLAQYVLSNLLAKKHRNITIVGDFSQSIYSWRGADIRNLEKFQKDYPEAKIFYLEKNYRSTQNILDFAFKIITQNKSHPILHLKSDNLRGEEIVFFEADNEQDEVIFVTEEISKLINQYGYTTFSILYRTNAQSRIMEEALLHYGIPYILVGGTRFYERREIKDVLSYLRLLVNPKDQVAKDRLIKLGKKRWNDFAQFYKQKEQNLKKKTTDELIEQIFKTTKYLDRFNINDQEDYGRLENIRELKSVAIKFPNLIEFLEQVALVESEYFENEKRSKNKEGIKLMTLHQAKGLEFDCVFIIGVEEGLLPHSRSMGDYFQLEEERRLFYVGITRTKQKLYITNARKRFIFGRRNYSLKSRFLMEEEF